MMDCEKDADDDEEYRKHQGLIEVGWRASVLGVLKTITNGRRYSRCDIFGSGSRVHAVTTTAESN
jgi:hypothetical protein